MKFTLISVHGQEPAYYRIIDTLDELLSIDERFAQFYFREFFSDPHIEAELEKGQLGMSHFRHPLNVLPKRALSLFNQWISGSKIALNKVGGWMIINNDCQIISEIESKA